MIDLKRELERELSILDPPDLWNRIEAAVSNATDAPIDDANSAWHRRHGLLWLAAAVIVALLTVVAAASGRDDTRTVETTPATEAPPVTERPINDQLRPHDRIGTTSCRAAFGLATVGVQISNYSSTASRYATTDYVVRISIRDGTGATIGEAIATADDVPSGETREVEAVARITHDSRTGPEVMNCIVKNVERVPST